MDLEEYLLRFYSENSSEKNHSKSFVFKLKSLTMTRPMVILKNIFSAKVPKWKM